MSKPKNYGDNGVCSFQKHGVKISNTSNQRLEILPIHQVSIDFHEAGILSGYRKPSSSIKLGILSIFQLHNETLNIWTQIIPAIYFILELFLCLFHVGERFLIIYLVTVTAFLFTSSCAHTLSCLSSRARHVCFFLDYVGITLYSSGCAVCYYAFSLPTDILRISADVGSNLCDMYLLFSVFLCIAGTHLSCQTRFWKPSLLRNIVRMSAFAINIIYLAVPVLWRSFRCKHQLVSEYHSAECASVNYWDLHFLSTFSAGLLYVSHFPEKWFPGKFDIFGHSHQIFHVFSALGSVTQYYALRTDLRERKIFLTSLSHIPSIPLSILCLIMVVFCNSLIFWKFYRKVYTVTREKYQ